MVIKGTSCAGAKRLAVHLTRTDTNERAEVKELRGVVAEDLRGALLEMEAVAAGTRSTKPFYHGSINTRAEERLTDEQRMVAIDRLEAALGLTGQARVVVVHEKEGREHCHIVWSRIDLERMAAISDSHNYRKHEEVARALEREFGHERVQGAHVERDGKERPKRTPSHAEMLQAERTGLTAAQVKEQVTALWRDAETGRDFFVALWEHAYVLAQGDRRDFVIIDPRGGTHSLARRVEGAKAKDIREKMADLDPDRLYSVADAKQIQRARQARDAAPRQDTPREPSRETSSPAPQAREGQPTGTPEPAGGAGARAVFGIPNALAGPLDGVANLFEALIAGEEHKPQTAEERAEFARKQQEATKARSAPAEEAARDLSARQAEETRVKQVQKIMREHGYGLPEGRDADREPDGDRERDRGRG